MTDPTSPAQDAPAADSNGGQPAWLARNPWVTFVLPFAVFMLVGACEPSQDKPFELLGLSLDFSAYPLVYGAKIALTLVAIAIVWPGYRPFPLRVSWLAPLVGVIGVVLWIGICKLKLEETLLVPLGLGEVLGLGKRAGFNPLTHWAEDPGKAYGFLALRFFGLAVVVPIIEELFLRGFVMRFLVDPDWWKVPIGKFTPAAIAAGTIVPMLMHPAELFAAAVWFTLITWLEFKTKNIWDCVLAHAVTNLLLGAWVVYSGDWFFL